MNDLQFIYLKDPTDDRRVLTIGYIVDGPFSDDGKGIRYNFTLNKIADDWTLDSRLIEFLGKERFNDLQKKFKKRFGGDQHNKKIAKEVIREKFIEHGSYNVFLTSRDTNVKPLLLILVDIYKNIDNWYASRISKHYYEAILLEALDEVKNNISGGWQSVGEKI